MNLITHLYTNNLDLSDHIVDILNNLDGVMRITNTQDEISGIFVPKHHI